MCITQSVTVNWQESADRTRLIGHMILKKNFETEDKLGLKIMGGKIGPTGRQCAIVEKVKRGSIADQEGHIKPGKLYRSTQNA